MLMRELKRHGSCATALERTLGFSSMYFLQKFARPLGFSQKVKQK